MVDRNEDVNLDGEQDEPESVEEAPTVGESPAPVADRAPVLEVDAVAAVEATPEPEPEPEPDKSLLKKEISFRRKPKEPKAAKEPKAKTPKAPKEPKAKKPKAEGSGLKKEISFSFKRKPKAEQPAEAAAPKPKKERAKRVRGERSTAAKRTKRLVGLKIGASQLAAARIVNNGTLSWSRSRARTWRRASWSAASCASPSSWPRP